MRSVIAFAVAIAAAACLTISEGAAANESTAAARRYELNIPRQTLDTALKDLAQQTGLQVARFSDAVKGDTVVGPLSGTYSAAQALERLLTPSGLTYRSLNEHAYIVLTPEELTRQPAAADALHAAEELGRSSQTGKVRLAKVQGEEARGGAQSSGGGDSATDKEVSEIVVTAQKRSERIQDVPIPVTTISADKLLFNNQLRIQDYYTKIPGLTVTPSTQSQQILVIRGITTGSGNPSVGVTIDDIPYGSSTFLGGGNVFPDLDPSDLERIEVLRGPQGTLYGASSMGGLFKFVTRDPSMERFSARVGGSVNSVENGADLGYSIRGSVNVPLGERAAFSASAFHRTDPGYIDNIQTGEEGINRVRSNGGLLTGLFHLGDTFSLKLNALIDKSESDGVTEVDASTPDLKQKRLPDSGAYERKREIYSAVLTGKVGSVDLTSVSGYNINSHFTPFDNTPIAQAGISGILLTSDLQVKKFSQEIRLSAPLTAKLQLLVGGFYTDEDVRFLQNLWSVNPATGAKIARSLFASAPTTYEEYAAFANLTYQFTDRFDVQAGARQSYITPTSAQTVIAGTAPPAVLSKVKVDMDAFTYLISPRFRLSPDLMLYARVASGYRAGGPNFIPSPNPGNVVPAQYGPDKTQDYEIGIKGDFLDHRLSVDASAYYIDWKDIQVTLIVPPPVNAGYITNGSRAKSQGVEISGAVRPLTGLSISGWVAWNTAELTEAFPATSSTRGVVGERLPYSSRFSGNLALEQTFPLWPGVDGYVGGEASRIGDRMGRFISGVTAQRQAFPEYSKFDLSAGLRADSWTATLFVTNLTDERGILTGGLGAAPAIIYTYIQPRTVGLSFTRSW